MKLTEKKCLKIVLSPCLFDKLDKRAQKLGFKNKEEYISFVLEELTEDEENRKQASENEQEEMKKKLKALGYI